MAGNKLSPSKRKRDGAPVGGQRRLSDMGSTIRVSGAAEPLPPHCRHLPPAAAWRQLPVHDPLPHPASPCHPTCPPGHTPCRAGQQQGAAAAAGPAGPGSQAAQGGDHTAGPRPAPGHRSTAHPSWPDACRQGPGLGQQGSQAAGGQGARYSGQGPGSARRQGQAAGSAAREQGGRQGQAAHAGQGEALCESRLVGWQRANLLPLRYPVLCPLRRHRTRAHRLPQSSSSPPHAAALLQVKHCGVEYEPGHTVYVVTDDSLVGRDLRWAHWSKQRVNAPG